MTNEKKNEKKVVEEVLSEEDQAMKDRIDNYITALLDPTSQASVVAQSIELMKKEVKESTTTMTSVPKPFKFIKTHYAPLVKHYAAVKATAGREVIMKLADIMSILAMSYSDVPQESLRYLLESSREEVCEWGYGYMSHLSGEIGVEYQKRVAERQDTSELVALVTRLAPKLIETNAESEAVDLLLEVDQLSLIS